MTKTKSVTLIIILFVIIFVLFIVVIRYIMKDVNTLTGLTSAQTMQTIAPSDLATSTTYKVRIAKQDGSGTGTGAVENNTTTRSRFFAVRIA